MTRIILTIIRETYRYFKYYRHDIYLSEGWLRESKKRN